MERKTRFELATLALARRCSTTEPLPRFNEKNTKNFSPLRGSSPSDILHVLKLTHTLLETKGFLCRAKFLKEILLVRVEGLEQPLAPRVSVPLALLEFATCCFRIILLTLTGFKSFRHDFNFGAGRGT